MWPTILSCGRRTDGLTDWSRALDDIRASIRELQFYRENIFIPAESKPAADKEGAEQVAEGLSTIKI